MKNSRPIAVILALAAGVFWLAAAVMRKFPTMPAAASAQAAYVDSAWNTLLIVEGVVFALVVAYLAYCLAAFRAKDRAEEGAAFSGSPGGVVEFSWILGSAALTLALAAFGARELNALIAQRDADIDVEVHASQFTWEFYYPQFKQYGAKLYLERGKRHRLILTSKDVVHSFWVPEFRVKQDAVPGKAIPLILTPTADGEYTILCNQLCGWGHTEMQSIVQVMDHEAFEAALKGEF